ncbi:MAG: NAD(P)-dependent malic enzyme, partial [Trebonia sp.]
MAAEPVLPYSYDADPVFTMHRGGKIHVQSTVEVEDRAALAMAYTPGVARVCSAIAEHPELASEYTWTGNTVAVVSDGTAVLGLGDIGPAAAMPVMEGKALLFKRFAGIDAVPVCIACTEVEEVVAVVAALAPSFGGINLEDISAPRCFEIEDRLRALLDIPVFHDDQHGTAIVVLAALMNALRVVDKPLSSVRAAVLGVGAAGVAICRLLLAAGIGDIVAVDRQGILAADLPGLDDDRAEVAARTNVERRAGGITEALKGADVFVGVAGASLIDETHLASMGRDPIVFALANPDPEIDPALARNCAAVVATGR